MPALIFAARALLSRATLSHNGVELAPAFPLATSEAYHRCSFPPCHWSHPQFLSGTFKLLGIRLRAFYERANDRTFLIAR